MIIIAILLFGVIVLVHEFGHFIFAKKNGVTVHEFALGMGPKLFGIERNGTVYSVRILPIGGFCAMEGEDENQMILGHLVKNPYYKELVLYLQDHFLT